MSNASKASVSSDIRSESAFKELKAEALPPIPAERFVVGDSTLAPFPRARFLAFVARLKVQSKDIGLAPFKLLGSQQYILDELERGLAEGVSTFVILKARQLGSSTFFLALDLFWAFNYRGLLGVFITHKEESRDDFRSAIEVFFAETPKSHKVTYVRHNRNLLILKNGSKFRYLVAGTAENRKGGLGRSGSANYVHSTETFFYGNADDLSEFRSQTSNLYPHRLQIYESTANGFNHGFDMWEQAKIDPTKRAIFVGWWRDERNAFALNHPYFLQFMPDGIDTRLLPIERKRVREVKEQYGFDISLQQIAWYRWHLASEKGSDQGSMDQEYPWTADDAFVATGSKFFTAEALTTAMREAKQHPCLTYRYRLGHRFEDTSLQQLRDARAPLKVWEPASQFGSYCAGIDPAYGSSDEADRTVVSVWRCHADAMVQVAEFCTSEPSTYQCAWVVAHLCGYFGQQFIMPVMEMNGPGQAVYDELEKVRRLTADMKAEAGNAEDPRHELRNVLKYMRHFFYRRMDSLGGGLLLQWKTTHDLKSRAMNQLKNGIELGRVHPRSVGLIDEMRRIVNDEGWIGGQGHAKDDRVMAAALAYQGWSAWVQPRMNAQGLTMARSRELDETGGKARPMDRLIHSYLKRANIALPEGSTPGG